MRIGFFQYDVAHDAEKNLNRLKFYLQQQKCEIAFHYPSPQKN